VRLSVKVTLVGHGGYGIPAWKTWWLLSESASGDGPWAARLTVASQDPDLSLAPPVPAPAGARYKLRLVLSHSQEDVGWQVDAPHVFDSDPFLLDLPPSDGLCEVQPSVGTAAATLFEVSTRGWVDDDLPLDYRFSRRMASSTGAPWTILSQWSSEASVGQILLGAPGEITTRAEARDTLGSVSSAYAAAEVVEREGPTSSAELLRTLEQIASSGSPLSTLTAITAVADAWAGPSFAGALLDKVGTSGALDAPSNEALATVSSTLSSVIQSSLRQPEGVDVAPGSGNRTAPEEVEMGLARKAAAMIVSISDAAFQLEGGLEQSTAGGLLGVVETLLGSVAGAPSPASGDNDTAALEQQRGLSSQLTTAVSAIGDAVVIGQAVGETVSIPGPGGSTLSLRREDGVALASRGSALETFVVPPLADALALAGGSTGALHLQHMTWSKNPFAHTNASAASNLSGALVGFGPVLSPEVGRRSWWEEFVAWWVSLFGLLLPVAQGTLTECCDLVEGALQTLDVRKSGRSVPVTNLSVPIVFTLNATQPQAGESEVQQRLCQYFDVQNQTWSDEGCWIVSETNETITCACSHLTTFGAGPQSKFWSHGFTLRTRRGVGVRTVAASKSG
jgi:hypothetical protein